MDRLVVVSRPDGFGTSGSAENEPVPQMSELPFSNLLHCTELSQAELLQGDCGIGQETATATGSLRSIQHAAQGPQVILAALRSELGAHLVRRLQWKYTGIVA